MKRFAISVLLLLLSSSTFCQVNLVLNGDFEAHTYCPQVNDNINLANYWSAIDSLSAQSETCIPDYCHTCGSKVYNANTVPASTSYWQYPHSGNGMAQVVMFYNEASSFQRQRDYLQGRLAKKLVTGKRYCVSFYVNLAEASRYAIKEISAYLDNGSIDTATMCWKAQTQYNPQISNANGILSDTLHWIRVEESFLSKGTEQFITIGNFKDKVHTTYISLPINGYNDSLVSGYNGSFYLVDDVSVVESDTKADAGPDRYINYGDSVYIGRPSSEAIWCDWRVLGFPTIIGSGPGIWVKPTVTTSYVMSQTLCGYTTTDTVKVFVGETGVAGVGAADVQQYLLMPNPNDGNITLLQKLADSEPVSIKVYNSVGAVVRSFNTAFESNTTMLHLNNIPAGVYYMILSDSAGQSYHLTFVKK